MRVAVNVCINCCFIYLCLLFYYTQPILVVLVYPVYCFPAFLLVPYWPIFDSLRYVSYLHSVRTISAISSYFAPFIQVKYFDDREAFYSRFGHFSLHMRRNGIISTSGANAKHVVTIVLSNIDFL